MDIQEEKEFDPTVHTAEYVAVEHDESFAQIRDKIEEALRRTPNVILIIPRGAEAFHTTQDFLALGKLQWRREVRVAVATPDPTIAGLARVLGFHIVEPPADHPALMGDPGIDSSSAQDDHNGTVEKPTSPLPLGGLPGASGTPDWVLSPPLPSSTYSPRVSTSGSLTTSTWLSMPGDGTDSQPTLDSPRSSTRSGQPPPRRRQRHTGQLLPNQAPELISDPSLEASNEANAAQIGEQDEFRARLAVLEGKAYTSGRGWRYGGSLRRGSIARILVSLAIVLLLIAGAATGYAYIYLPEGKVLVVPKSKAITGLPVHINVNTGIPNPIGPAGTTPPEQLEPGQSFVQASSLIATPIQQPLEEEGTAPATGTRQIPRGRGAGTLHFVNTTAQTQFVPEGATFEAANGVVVQTTEAGSVNPTNFAAQQFGTLDLPIVANVEGPGGNIEAGKIQGTYKGVLTYANYAMQGGSLETVKVVLQEDIDKLKAELSAKVHAGVDGAIAANVGSGTLITQTIHLENEQSSSIPLANQDGESVAVKVTGLAAAYTYSETEMINELRQAVYDHIQSNEPANYGPITDLDSILFTEPVLQPSGGESQQGVITYVVNASANVKYSLTDSLALAIRDLVAGESIKDVPALVSDSQFGNYVNIPADKIDAKVLWFDLDKLPTDPTRIEVQQLGNTGNTATIPQPNAELRGDQR
jgi:hypothetical protein